MPVMIGAGSALVTAAIMQARAECLVSRQKEKIAELRAALGAERTVLEERIRRAEETARRAALDEVMADIRVEDRRFTHGRSLFIQERVCFRSIPLTSWVEREIPAAAEPQRPVRVLQAAGVTCP
jgi:hypothetical protein